MERGVSCIIMREKRTADQLSGVEKECYERLKDYQKAVDNNTEWCIAFWDINLFSDYDPDKEWMDTIRKYPPESLTKYRRNLIFDGLIHPTEESKEHSIEMEKKNHSPAVAIHYQQARKTVSMFGEYKNPNPLA